MSSVNPQDFACDVASDPSKWRHLVRFEPGKRTYSLLCDEPQINAWVLTWEDGSDTGFHDHDISAAGIAIVQGEVTEERLMLEGDRFSRTYRTGDSFFLPKSAIHRMQYGDGQPAISIHAYSPPLRMQGVYRISLDGTLERHPRPSTKALRAQRLQD